MEKAGLAKLDLIILGEGLPVDSFEACCQLRQAVDVPVPCAEGWVGWLEAGTDFY